MEKKLVIDNQILDINNLNKYILCNSTKISEYFKNSEQFVDLIVTSPPYYDAKEYTKGNYQETGFNQTYDEYLDDIRKTFKGIYEISKDSASLYLNIDTVKRNGRLKRLPDDIANILEEIGWIHKDVIIWDKVKTLPYSRKGQARNVFEYILLFTKTNDNYKYYEERIKSIEPKHWWLKHPEKYSPQGVAPSNIWSFSIPPQGSWGSKSKDERNVLKHACPFPPELLARIILLSTDRNDVVFDPYAGTGILLMVAKKLERRYLGLDISEESKNIFNNAAQEFVNNRWIEIDAYYKFQNKIKPLYYRTIINLRVLKYSKILQKKIKEKNMGEKINDIIITLVEKYNKVDNGVKRKKYVEILNIMISDEIKDIKEYEAEVKLIMCRPPLSKYSIESRFVLLNTQQFKEYLNKLDYPLYKYKNGDIENYDKIINNKAELNEEIDYKLEVNRKCKSILISNIEMNYDNYSVLLEETKTEEKPRDYKALCEKYNFK